MDKCPDQDQAVSFRMSRSTVDRVVLSHHRPAGGHTGVGVGGKGRDFRLRQTPLESWLCHHWLSGLGQVVEAPQASIH